MTTHQVARALLLGLAVCGMVASVFWDTVESHLKAFQGEGPGAGACPVLPGTGTTSAGHLPDVETLVHAADLDTAGWPQLAPEELAFYDGTASGGKAVTLVAVDGWAFDVSSAADQYAPGGKYAALAGREATTALVLGDLGAPEDVDKLGSLDQHRRHTWFSFFYHRYPRLARVEAGTEQRACSDAKAHAWLYGPLGVRHGDCPA